MHEYWLTKALWYVDNQKTNVRVRKYPNDEGFYYIVLRKDNTLGAKNLSDALVRDIELVVQGIRIVSES